MVTETKDKGIMDKNKSKTKKSKKTNPVKVKTTKFHGLEGNFLLVRVGTPDIMATDQQIEDIEKKLVALFEKNNINCAAFVTHHAVAMDVIL